MNVAIIGAGLIGAKRAGAIIQNSDLKLICDIDLKRAKELANKYDTDFCADYNEVVYHNEIDIVIVATTNKFLSQISIDCLYAGKHILCEKPLGRNVKESKSILVAAEKSGKIIKTGFNHRFHPAILKAKSLLKNKEIGEIINIRARYGHGGRPGMEKEWRCSKELCGGGELIDQGVHIIDLCRWFAGDVKEVYGKTINSYWPVEVEDNAFFLLTHESKVVAQCHVSWSNWKNIFSFEIFGKDGYIRIDGLGGNYGKETLELGFRNSRGGIPRIEQFEFDNEDNSWVLEWQEFEKAIEENREPSGSGNDGYSTNVIIDAIYKSNDLNKPVSVN